MSFENDTGPCFYCPDLPEIGETVNLGEAETHHAGAARRIRVGDSIGLIDGKGVRGAGVAMTVTRKKLTVTVKERTRIKPPALSIHVASAVPKGERFRTMIEMLTQIGVTGIMPLICERSTVKPKASSHHRWLRIAIEACKQSRNPYVPEILEPRNVREALAKTRNGDKIAVADVDGMGLNGISLSTGRLYLFVGPEGGFTETEMDLLRERDARPLNLGDNVLRVETAAIVGVALCLQSSDR